MADKIEAGLTEALAVVRGEAPAARVIVNGHAYVPEAECAALIHDLESANRSLLAETEARAAAEAECDALRAALKPFCEARNLSDHKKTILMVTNCRGEREALTELGRAEDRARAALNKENTDG